jgi:sulfate adenylyltransferase subunit 1
VTVLPSGFTTRIKKVFHDGKELEEAFAPQSITMTLENEIDISRGDMLVKANNPPEQGQNLEAMICWFSNQNLNPRAKFIIRHTSRETKAIVQSVSYKVDINTLRKEEEVSEFTLNEIGRISLRTAAPLFYDSYNENRHTGSFILIDPGTNETVAAGMLL